MSVDVDPVIVKLSARAIVRRWFEELSDDLDEFSLPAITNQVFERVKADADLFERLTEECLRPIVYDLGLAVLASQRARRSRAAPVREALHALVAPPPDEPAAFDLRAAKARRTRQPASRAGFDWLKQPIAVAQGRTIRLRRALRIDLDQAIEFGGQSIESARVKMAHYELIKEGLASDTERVADRYTDEQLAALWARAERRIAAENAALAEVKARVEARRLNAASTAAAP